MRIPSKVCAIETHAIHRDEDHIGDPLTRHKGIAVFTTAREHHKSDCKNSVHEWPPLRAVYTTPQMTTLLSILLMLCCSDETPREPDASSRLMEVLDQDGDSALSPAEFARVAHPDQSFESADTNGDQSIDIDELEQLLLQESPLLENHRGGHASSK